MNNRSRLPMVIGSLGLGMACCAMLLLGRPAWALIAHLTAATLVIATCRGWRIEQWWQWVLALAMPAFGPLLVALHQAGDGRGGSGVADDYAAFMADQQGVALGTATAPNAPGEVVALRDLLAAPASEDRKRAAILALERMESPKAVAILRSALADPSPEVRIYANSALDRIDGRLRERIHILERQLGTMRHQAARIHLDLASTWFDGIWLGLAQDRQRDQAIEQAYQHAQAAIAGGAGPKAWLVAGRAQLARRDFREAAVLFDAYLDAVPGDRSALVWRAEARFHLGDYAGTASDAALAEQGSSHRLSKTIRPAVAMWAGRRVGGERRETGR